MFYLLHVWAIALSNGCGLAPQGTGLSYGLPEWSVTPVQKAASEPAGFAYTFTWNGSFGTCEPCCAKPEFNQHDEEATKAYPHSQWPGVNLNAVAPDPRPEDQQARRKDNPERSVHYTIRRAKKATEAQNEFSGKQSESRGATQDEVSFLAWRTLVAGSLSVKAFDFAHPASQEEGRLPWYEGPLDEGFELMTNGASLHDVMTHVIEAFHAFDDITFQEENEPALNSILRALVRFHDRELRAPRVGPQPLISRRRLRQFGREMANLVRDRWHWLRCPRAMQNRAAEAHLRRLGIGLTNLPPEDYWQEEVERRQRSRTRTPQRGRRGQPVHPVSESDGDSDGEVSSLAQERKRTASQESGMGTSRRRRSHEWRTRVAMELGNMRSTKAVANARRKLFYHLSRMEGPDILNYAEDVMAEVWSMVDRVEPSSHTSETTADEWAQRTAEHLISMWRSRDQHAQGPTGSQDHGVPADQGFALDPPEAIPFGIFHAAYVWENGTWNTRAEMCRMGYGHLLHREPTTETPEPEPEVHEPDVAGGRAEAGEATEDADGGSRLDPDVEHDGASLVQTTSTTRLTWRQLMDQLDIWQEQGVQVREALDLLEALVNRRGHQEYARWASNPLASIRRSVEEDDTSVGGGPVLDTTRARTWVENVELLLWEAFDRDIMNRRGRRAPDAEELHLMERHRSAAGRRRRTGTRRESRSPRRGRSNRRITVTESVRYLGDPRDCYATREVIRNNPGSSSRGPEALARRTGGPRPVPSRASTGDGRPGSSTNRTGNLTQPLSRDEATDLWRYLLGVDRESWTAGRRVIGAGHAFLTAEQQNNIREHFRTMSGQNRLLLTTTFVEVLRYVMAEVSNLMHQGEMQARDDANELVEVTLDESDDHREADEPEPEAEGDGSQLMQRFALTGGKENDEDRWSRDLVRLQKELTQKREEVRAACIRRLRQALPACEPGSIREARREQLRALLLAMWDAPAGGTPTTPADEEWLGSWGNELEYFLPGLLFPLAVLPTPEGGPLVLQVDSGHTNEEELDPEAASPSSVPTVAAPTETSPKRKMEVDRLAKQEEELVQAQAAAYQQWEREQMDRELSRVTGKRRALECCRITVEASSSSTERPRVCHSYSFMVPSNGDAIHVGISAQMVQDPEWAPSPVTETQQAQCDSMVGANVLDLLEFGDYEKIYQAWKDKKVTTKEVEEQWGREVAELIVTHDLVAEQGAHDTMDAIGGPALGHAPTTHGGLHGGAAGAQLAETAKATGALARMQGCDTQLDGKDSGDAKYDEGEY